MEKFKINLAKTLYSRPITFFILSYIGGLFVGLNLVDSLQQKMAVFAIFIWPGLLVWVGLYGGFLKWLDPSESADVSYSGGYYRNSSRYGSSSSRSSSRSKSRQRSGKSHSPAIQYDQSQKPDRLPQYSPASTEDFKPRLKALLTDMQSRRKETEEAAMEIAITYEQAQGRTVHDVSKLNVGYDLLSIDTKGVHRHIEVKSTAGMNDVRLTQHELSVALKMPKSYFVYIVDNCASEASKALYIVSNLTKDLVIPEVKNYAISLEDQNMATDFKCTI